MTSEQFEKNTRTNTLLTLASRITGLVRDGAMSRVFGAGSFASAFYFAFLIPNLFRRLFGEGALAAAFLPAYSKLHYENEAQAKAFATLTLSTLTLFLGGIVIALELILLAVLSMQEEPKLSVQLTMVMLPYMPLVCIVAILAAMLHVHGKFGPPAAAPIILNSAMIGATVGLIHFFDSESKHMFAIAIAVVIAGIIQVIWSLFALRRVGWFSSEASRMRGELRKLMRTTLPMIVGLGVLQINTLCDGLIASWATLFGDTVFGVAYPLQESAMSELSFGQRLYQFPLGVFGIAIATAIYPLLAKQHQDENGFSETMRRGLRSVMFIGLPASAGLILVREPLTASVFQGGAFTSEDTLTVSAILLGYAPAVWAFSMCGVLTKGFYARGNTMTPVKVAIGCMVLNSILNVTLIWTPLNTAGLAWSTSVCAVLQAAILMSLISKEARPFDGSVFVSWLKASLLTLAMSTVVVYLLQLEIFQSSSWEGSIQILAIIVPVAAGFYALGSIALRMPEFKWALGFKSQ